MKKIIFVLIVHLSFWSFAQVGINTEQPTEMLDVNGIFRVRDLPLNGENNAIYTNPSGVRSATKDQTFNATRTVVADANGVIGYVNGVNNFTFDSYLDLQGTGQQSVAPGNTIDVNGITGININVAAGSKKLLLFQFTGYARGSANSQTTAGQGAFGLWNTTDNVKVTSIYTNFFSHPTSSFYSIPNNTGFTKAVILDNSTGSSAKMWTFKMTYKAWATATNASDKNHLINFTETGYSDPNNDPESLKSRLLITVYNM